MPEKLQELFPMDNCKDVEDLRELQAYMRYITTQIERQQIQEKITTLVLTYTIETRERIPGSLYSKQLVRLLKRNRFLFHTALESIILFEK